MEITTHIEALVRLATSLHQGSTNSQKTHPPIQQLAEYLGVKPQSFQFARILTWMIAFYEDALDAISNSPLSDKNRVTAISNLQALFSPFLPPSFGGSIGTWYNQVMSATNESYFDLLSDTIKQHKPIYLPSKTDTQKMVNELSELLDQLEGVGLPRWINDDFKGSIGLTVLVLEKIPFLAHRIVNDMHGSIVSKLLLVVPESQKQFLVKAATAINIVLAAFVMPSEAQEAYDSYYGWFAESPSDSRLIEQMAKPLALPSPR